MGDSSDLFIPPLGIPRTGSSPPSSTESASPRLTESSLLNLPAEGATLSYVDSRSQSPSSPHPRIDSPLPSPGQLIRYSPRYSPPHWTNEIDAPPSPFIPPLGSISDGPGGRSVSFAETNAFISPGLSPGPTLSPATSLSENEFLYIRGYFFDLSSPKFAPMQFTERETLEYIRVEELEKPATDPPIFELRVSCHLIPQWPVIFQPNLERLPSSGKLSPITIGDILARIYYCMHLPVLKADWDNLPEEGRSVVVKAFQRRCRLSGATAKEEKVKGVKRIDFCGDKVWFKEIISTPTWDGKQLVELILTEGAI